LARSPSHGVGGIAAGITGKDIATGKDLHLTEQQKGEQLGGGLVNATMTVLTVLGLGKAAKGLFKSGEGGSAPADTAPPEAPARDLTAEFRGRTIKAEARKINLRVGDASEKGSGLEYAWKRHGGGGPNTKSQFTISQDGLKAILQRKDVISSPIRPAGPSGNFVREVDVGTVIGNLPRQG
jgi:filamentous hemagglutinin